MPGTELFGEEEKKEVMDVLETGVLFRYNHDVQRKGVWKAKEFEAEIAKFTGAKHALAVSSGSCAVSAMLAACGVGYGDEVIVPPFTFVATIEAVLLAGALPVFAEIDGILAVCKEKNVMLIEDTAQALGATYKGKHLGLFGKMGSFSFDFFKITTCGEGGVIISNDEALIQSAEYISDHGHSHEGDNRGMEPHHMMGTNFRIGEINAAIGLAQTRKLPKILKAQRKHKAVISERLGRIRGVTFRKQCDDGGDSATFFHLLMPDETKARTCVKLLGEAGIGVAYWYDNMYHYIKQWDHVKDLKMPYRMVAHELGLPQDLKTLAFPKSNAVMCRLISFGIRVTWTEQELNTMLDKMEVAVKKSMEKVLA